MSVDLREELSAAGGAAMAPAAPALAARLPGLDVLRALAAGAVVVNHLVPASLFWMNAGQGRGAFVFRVTDMCGAWGVALFFVLSGFCIHLPMARRRALDPSARLLTAAYFKRRFLRIYPPHAIALLLSAALAAALPPAQRLFVSVPSARQWVAHALMLHTFVPGAMYSGNVVLWTIAIEAHFYVLYPLILRVAARAGMLRLAVALFGVWLLLKGLGVYVLPAPVGELLTINFPGRLWEWVLGCAAAEAWVRGPVSRRLSAGAVAALLASLGIGMAVIPLHRALQIQGVLWPPLFAVLVYCAASLRPRGGWGVPVDVGRASYSLYLTHPIALTIAGALLVVTDVPRAGCVALALALVAAATTLFFRLVERPFLRAAARHATV